MPTQILCGIIISLILRARWKRRGTSSEAAIFAAGLPVNRITINAAVAAREKGALPGELPGSRLCCFAPSSRAGRKRGQWAPARPNLSRWGGQDICHLSLKLESCPPAQHGARIMVASDENLDELPMVKSTFSRTLSAAQLYEMYVVSAESLIEMTSIRPFEDERELLAEGMLVEFDDTKWNAMFVSHQWAGVGHPDPHMEQFKVLQQALKNVLSGKTAIHANINIELYVGQRPGMTAEDRAYVMCKESGEDFMEKPLYIWYDYFSCPQAACELAHRQMAIISIPAYVERCRYFTVLCPHVRHELSVHDEACDTIEIQSGQHQALAANFDWIKEPVGEGFFTVEKDRMRIAPVLQAMLRNKISSYLDKKDYHNYRLMLNLQNRHFTGLPIKPDYDFIPGFQSEARDPAEHLMAQILGAATELLQQALHSLRLAADTDGKCPPSAENEYQIRKICLSTAPGLEGVRSDHVSPKYENKAATTTCQEDWSARAATCAETQTDVEMISRPMCETLMHQLYAKCEAAIVEGNKKSLEQKMLIDDLQEQVHEARVWPSRLE
eukprot:s3470_g1.t8